MVTVVVNMRSVEGFHRIRHRKIGYKRGIPEKMVDLPVIFCTFNIPCHHGEVPGIQDLSEGRVPVARGFLIFVKKPVEQTQSGFIIGRIRSYWSHADCPVIILVPVRIICAANVSKCSFVFRPHECFSQAFRIVVGGG